MSVIGNDNNKTAPDSLNSKGRPKSRLSGNMAQLMVFLNGLILTFTAFATLSVFINQIVEEAVMFTARETREHFSERFENLAH